MAAELPRPGVEVIQVFRTVSPTVVSPTLTPTVVGVCKQIVDVVVPSAAGGNQLNSNALVNLPGCFVALDSVGGVYAGLNGLTLVLSINNGPDVTTTFAGNSLSPASVAAQITAAFVAAGVTEALAGKYKTAAFWVYTLGVGEFQTVEIKAASAPAVLAAFGLIAGYVFAGSMAYQQDGLVAPLTSFPDPNHNLTQLSIEPASVRVMLGLGSGINLRELATKEAFLRAGGGGAAAVLIGTIALAGGMYGIGGTLDGTTLSVQLDAAIAPVAIALGVGAAAPVSAPDLLRKINVALGKMVATDSGAGLRLTSKTKGVTSRVQASGTAAAVLGFVAPNNDVKGVAGVVIADDGNGDAVSPLVQVVGENFSAVGTAGTCSGVVDLTGLAYPGDLAAKTLVLAVSGRPPQTLVFGAPGNAAAVVTAINGFWTGLLVASLVANKLVLTTVGLGEDGAVEVIGGTAMETLGLLPNLTGSVALTSILPDLTTLNAKKFKITTTTGTVEATFGGFVMGSVSADVAAFLNGVPAFAALAVADIAAGNFLRIRSKIGGVQGSTQMSLTISAASSAEAAQYMGFDAGQTAVFYLFAGSPHPPLPGDDLYVDGAIVGRITQVSPGGTTTRLRMDKQIPISATFGTFHSIRAKNLVPVSATRPVPELVVDGDGVPTIKHDMLRDINGVIQILKTTIYIAYRAVRLDVTSKAKNPGILRLDSTTQLEQVLPPININNPLGLGFYFALLNAPGAVVSGLGVDAISADAPYGTVEAFTRAAEFLEAFEVYAIAPLTHDETVAQVFNTHVSAMSAPDAKGERICLFNYKAPTKRLDKLISSGINGNTVGVGGLQLDTGAADLSALLLNAGINPIGMIPVSSGLFLDIASDSKKYSVSSIAGSIVVIRTAFAAGENDDGYYATTALNVAPLPASLINEPFAIRVRGAALTLPDGSMDKQGVAETYQGLGAAISNRRFISMVPDTVAATLGGLEQLIEGFYLCAARAGMIGQQPPQQSFTNFPITGFTKVVGSNEFFTEKQLNIIAAGGHDIVVQDNRGSPLISRFALTTDMTSIETRTDSINRVVDFTAKFMRRGLKSYIGRFNITQGFLDSLGHVIQGLLGFLTNIGVLIGANMNNIVQDENAPDTVLIDITLDVPYPCNFIRLTLVV